MSNHGVKDVSRSLHAYYSSRSTVVRSARGDSEYTHVPVLGYFCICQNLLRSVQSIQPFWTAVACLAMSRIRHRVEFAAFLSACSRAQSTGFFYPAHVPTPPVLEYRNLLTET
jgi:hypothetical protein